MGWRTCSSSRYIGGHWLAPIRVDSEQPFAASWPRIGAAEGGRAAWSCGRRRLRPKRGHAGGRAARRDARPRRRVVRRRDDRSTPTSAKRTGTSPDLAVSSTGQADVVYRVVEQRIAHRDPAAAPGRRGRGACASRTSTANAGRASARSTATRASRCVRPRRPTRPRSRSARPATAWSSGRSRTSNGVARIWARRLFGSTLDYVLPGQRRELHRHADRRRRRRAERGRLPAGAGGGRLPAGGRAAARRCPGPRIFLNTLPDGESASGAKFLGASVVDSAVAGRQRREVGPPSIDIDEKQDLRLLYDSNGTPRVIEGNDASALSGAALAGPALARRGTVRRA